MVWVWFAVVRMFKADLLLTTRLHPTADWSGLLVSLISDDLYFRQFSPNRILFSHDLRTPGSVVKL